MPARWSAQACLTAARTTSQCLSTSPSSMTRCRARARCAESKPRSSARPMVASIPERQRGAAVTSNGWLANSRPASLRRPDSSTVAAAGSLQLHTPVPRPSEACSVDHRRRPVPPHRAAAQRELKHQIHDQYEQLFPGPRRSSSPPRAGRAALLPSPPERARGNRSGSVNSVRHLSRERDESVNLSQRRLHHPHARSFSTLVTLRQSTSIGKEGSNVAAVIRSNKARRRTRTPASVAGPYWMSKLRSSAAIKGRVALSWSRSPGVRPGTSVRLPRIRAVASATGGTVGAISMSSPAPAAAPIAAGMAFSRPIRTASVNSRRVRDGSGFAGMRSLPLTCSKSRRSSRQRKMRSSMRA